MLQNVMLISLGFLVASLIALLCAPPIWRYAVSRTTAHIRARSPLTMAEIQADRDQLRADHAIETRKLEIIAKEVKEDAARRLIELSTKTEEIDRLAGHIEQQAAVIEEKEGEIAKLETRISTLEEELRAKIQEITEHKRALDREIKARGRARSERGEQRGVPPMPKSEPRLSAKQRLSPKMRAEISGLTDELEQLVGEIAEVGAKKQAMEQDRAALETMAAANGASNGAENGALNGVNGSGEKRRQIKLTALEAERARLLADLTGLEQRSRELGRKLQKTSGNWRGEANPFPALLESLETLHVQITALTSQLSRPDAEANAPQEKTANGAGSDDSKASLKDGAKDAANTDTSSAAPKPAVKSQPRHKSKTHGKPRSTPQAASKAASQQPGPQGDGKPPSLTDRIHALQNEPAE